MFFFSIKLIKIQRLLAKQWYQNYDMGPRIENRIVYSTPRRSSIICHFRMWCRKVDLIRLYFFISFSVFILRPLLTSDFDAALIWRPKFVRINKICIKSTNKYNFVSVPFFGSWFNHVKEFVDASRNTKRVHLIYYEEMKQVYSL